MNVKKLTLCLAMAVAGINLSKAAGPAFDLIPLWAIKVNYDGLKYADIKLKTADASAIVNNNIPQNLKFSIIIEKPSGFRDSSGFGLYGLELTLSGADGKRSSYSKDMFNGTGMVADNDKSTVSFSLGFDAQTKPNTKVHVAAKLFDRKGTGYVLMNFDLTVVAASKRLQNTVLSYNNKDSKGMRTASVGLHFNYFEFKGLAGNNFMYRIHKTDPVNFILKGLEGWKNNEGKVNPLGEIRILDADGNELETNEDVLAKTVGESMDKDRKELEVKYKPTTELQTGKFYFVWLKLRDRNSSKAALDVVVKVYIE